MTREQAEAAAIATRDFMREMEVAGMDAETEAALIRDEVVSLAATKGDLLNTEERLDSKIGLLKIEIERVEERLKAEIKQLDQSMTIKISGATLVMIGAVAALQRLFGS